MSPTSNAVIKIHFCVLLWGFTAIFGRLITLPAMDIVWWRMLLTAAALLIVPRVWRVFSATPIRSLAVYAGVGILVAIHWILFYESIKHSNASIGATCMALAPAFLAFIEPLVLRQSFQIRDLLLGAAVIPGVALIAGGMDKSMLDGLVIGVFAAFFAALFAAFNKRVAEHGDPMAVTCIEMGTGSLFVALAMILTSSADSLFILPDAHDTPLLLALAIGCTLLPFVLWLSTLRYLSAFSTQLAICLEPVYAIILGAMLLDEHKQLGMSFYMGAAVVMAAIGLQPLFSRRRTIR